MKLSSKGHYGVRAMAALARTYGTGPLSLTELAESEHLSLAYLEQLFATLRRAGLVESTRGMHGGYSLARHPSQVTVGEVVRALEGPISLVDCASESADSGCCERETVCASRTVWRRMRDSITEVLDSVTMADLCQEDGALDLPDSIMP